MHFIETSQLETYQWKSLHTLWNTEFPREIKKSTLVEFKETILKWQKTRHTLLLNNELIIGWFADFDRDNEHWFALIIDSGYHKKGLGQKLLAEGMKKNGSLCGWVINGAGYKRQDGLPYRNPLPFYLKMGFMLVPNVLLEKDGIKAVKIKWKK